MIKDILFVLWFFLPAALANMTPIFAAKLPVLRRLNFPLDCYVTFRDKRIFGSHKTVRGFISGVIVGILTVYLQVFLYATVPLLKTFVSVNYSAIDPLLLGLLASSEALTGDAVRSFFNREGRRCVGADRVKWEGTRTESERDKEKAHETTQKLSKRNAALVSANRT